MASAIDQKKQDEERFKKECRFWINRLPSLYSAAKRRNGGNSLSIYQEVIDLLDYLEGDKDLEPGLDLFQACDNLASRLRAA